MIRWFALLTFLLAAVGALGGFLVAHFTGWGPGVNGVGWGMTLAGSLAVLVVGGSGSPSDNLLRGRMGAFGTYWGQSAAQPQSPLWSLGSAVLVCAAGIAVVVLSY
ncbi:MAG TPA: hypothetical protein VHD91_09015 [Gaiellaceae bacterium]|nr:hypothetical protein [Gaiellaceae bacterium]